MLKYATESYRRLSTFINLYLLHAPPESTLLCETMKTMERLIDKGFVRFIRVSNFSVALIEEARSCLSKADIVAVQNRFSLFYRKDENMLFLIQKRRNYVHGIHTFRKREISK